ncbi:MAG: two-component system sensor histidine kinase HydH [Polyangiales bacterium]
MRFEVAVPWFGFVLDVPPPATSAVFREMAKAVGFGPTDERQLAELSPWLAPYFPKVVEEFYRVLLGNNEMASLFQDTDQVGRQKRSLQTWLVDVFSGGYDDEYLRRHAAIGRVHLRIGLSQKYTIAMMGVIRETLDGVIAENAPEGTDEVLSRRAIGRILDLELMVMLSTYSELHDERLRTHERLLTLGQLAGSVAHELRNPLAVIDTSAHLLLRRHGDDASAKHLNRIQEHTRLCTKIVHGLMDLARNQTVARASHSLAETIRIASAHPAIELSLAEIDAPHDDLLIGQVISNLVNNASEAGANRIRVSLRQDADHAVLEIRDDGPGVSPPVLARLFEPLVSGRSEGVGLGLALCRRIARAHGGTIDGENLSEGGALFTLRLPTMNPALGKDVL